MRFKQLFKIFIIVFWIFFGVSTLLQYSEIRPKGFFKHVAKVNQFLFPQGWGFFSKDALEEEYSLYKLDIKSNLFTRVSLKNSDKENLFGLSRNARLQMANEAQIFKSIKLLEHSKLKLKDLIIDEKTLRNIDSLKTYNIKKPELAKGTYLCLKKGIVPFMWSEINQANNIEIQILIFQT